MLIPGAIGLAVVLAQSSEPRVFVQPALVVTVQPEATANHRISPPLGGHAIGFGVGAGGFVTPTFALEGEFVYSGPVRTQQRFSYSWTEDFTGETRDVMLNALMRVRPSHARWLEIIGGAGLDIVRTGRRDIVRTDMYPFPPHTTPLPDYFTTYHRMSVTVGLEFPLRAGEHAALVPAFRARWRDRVSEDEAYYGVGTFAVQVGVGIRMIF